MTNELRDLSDLQEQTLKFFLTKSGNEQELLAYLDAQTQNIVGNTKLAADYEHMDQSQLGQYTCLQHIHPRFVQNALKQLDPDICPYVIALLPDELKDKALAVGYRLPKEEFSDLFKQYLVPNLSLFYEALDIRPNALMGHYELEKLFLLTQEQVIQFADYFGLCALAPVLKTIIDQPTRNLIKEGLKNSPHTEDTISFIRYLQRHCFKDLKTPLSFRFPLQLWNRKSSTQLFDLIRKYGLAAFGRILLAQPLSFTHRLFKNFDEEISKSLTLADQKTPPHIMHDLMLCYRWIDQYFEKK